MLANAKNAKNDLVVFRSALHPSPRQTGIFNNLILLF